MLYDPEDDYVEHDATDGYDVALRPEESLALATQYARDNGFAWDEGDDDGQ